MTTVMNSKYCVRIALVFLPVVVLSYVLVAGGCARKPSPSSRLPESTETASSSSDSKDAVERGADAKSQQAVADASSSSVPSSLPLQAPSDTERVCGSKNTANLPRFAQAIAEKPGILCPDGGRIAFVFDDDSRTSQRQPWQWLLTKTWNLKTTCDGVDRSPLDGAAPRFCESIQELATIGQDDELLPCIDPNGRPRVRTSRGHGDPAKAVDRSRTPAVEALDLICLRMEDQDVTGSLSMVVFAFDGVPDEGGTGSAAFEVAFADRLARCISERGIGVDVVAMPQNYAYYYVLSAPKFRSFGRATALALADEAARQRGATKPVVLRLTSDALTSGGRASIADVKMEMIDWSQRDGSLAPIDDPRIPWTRINTEQWLQTDSLSWVAWQLKWNARPEDWQAVAPDGTLLRPPEVHVNRELVPDADALFRASDRQVVVKPFEGCSMRQAVSKTCPPTGILFQALAVENGALELELIRNANNEPFDQMIQSATVKNSDQTANSSPRQIKHTQGFANQLENPNSARPGYPLLRMMLVSPALEIDDCAKDVREVTQDWLRARSTDQNSPAPDLSQKCRFSRLGQLYQAFSETKFKRFPCEDPKQVGARCDMGYGMATLAEAIVGTAKVQVSGGSNQKGLKRPDEEFGAPVILRLVQVVHECLAN